MVYAAALRVVVRKGMRVRFSPFLPQKGVVMDIGYIVRLLIGSLKGETGIYRGLANNSNWCRIELYNGSIILVNPGEFEKA